MAVPLDKFTRLLEESGVLAHDDVEALLSSVGAGLQPQDGEQLAKLLVKQKKLTPYQAKQVYAGKGKGLVLGNYVVVDLLGQGGMGQVLKAHHKRMKRLVALKILSPTVTQTPEGLRRFQREVEAAAKLAHPNIVHAYDADEANNTHFLVMEYVEGTDLAALVKQHEPLAVDQAVSCVLQAARGLEYAHNQGVVHRDIKPGNLLLDRSGTVKILDMGLARLDSAGTDQDQLTGTGQIMGTVDYMAPEQAMETKTADARADIYSLGITLWYLLTGRAVYEGETVVKRLMAHQNHPVPSLRAVCPQASPELEAVFTKMVAKTPEARYRSMNEVIVELRRCSGDASPEAETNRFTGSGTRSPDSLGRLSQGGRQAVAMPELAGELTTAPGNEATIDLQGATVDTDPHTQQTLVPLPSTQLFEPNALKQRSKPALSLGERWPWLRNRTTWIVAGGGGLALLMLAAIVLFVQTKDGAIRVEINDPEIQVTIKGTDIVLKQADQGHDVKLSPGDHTLIVQRGDFRFETNKLVLKQGEKVTVQVELLAGQVKVQQGEKLIGEGKLPVAWRGWPIDAPPPAIAPFNANQAKAFQVAWAEYLGVPAEYTNTLGMKFRLIPPGEFTMGSTEQEVEEALKFVVPFWHEAVRSQIPQHKVILTQPFYLGIHEVTQRHFEKLLERNPSVFSAKGAGKAAVEGLDTSNHPVDTTNWYDAAEFCLKLSQLEKLEPAYVREGEKFKPIAGAGYRLPMEAQWEFACRAGTTTRYWTGDDAKDGQKSDWIIYNSVGRPHAAGELQASPFGLYDVHGNVMEWVQDWWWPPYYQEFEKTPAVDPPGAPMEDNGSSGRVVRGGSWHADSKPVFCYAWHRHAHVPSARSGTIGFRISLPVEAVKSAIGQREIGLDQPQPAAPPVTEAASGDPDRAAAELLKPHANLTIRLSDGATLRINQADPLPSSTFTLVEVYMRPGAPLPGDFAASLFPNGGGPRALEAYRDWSYRVPLSEQDVARIAASPSASTLQEIGGRLQLTERNVETLKRFPKLTDIDFTADVAGDTELVRLKELPQLSGLGLTSLGRASQQKNTGLTEQGHEAIAALPVKRLNLSNSPGVTAKFARRIAAMPTLTELKLWAAPIQDDVVEALSHSRSLEVLSLEKTPVTDGCLGHLMKFTSLQLLRLNGSAVSAEGVKQLKTALPKCQVEWDRPRTTASTSKDPDRLAAELVKPHAKLTLRRPAGDVVIVEPKDPLPDGRFSLVELFVLPGTPLPPDFDAMLFPPGGGPPKLESFEDWNYRLQISNADVARLATAPMAEHLRNLHCNFQLSGENIDLLKKFSKVAEFHANAEQAGDDELSRLKELTAVTAIGLSHVGHSGKVTERGWDALTALPIEKLVLSQVVGIDARSADRLSAMPALNNLVLYNSDAGDEAIAKLAQSRQIVLLSLDRAPMTDAGLANLANVKSLRRLTLNDTRVSEAAVKKLAAALPACWISWNKLVIEPTSTEND